MGHTNSTANLSLPQFIGTDKPTWLGDVNGAFSALDSYAGTNDAAVAAAASDASSAISQAAAAVNTANTANTTAGNASTAANNAVGVANNAVAIAGTVDGKVGLLANLTTTDRTSIVNAINEVDGDIGDLTTLTTTDKSSVVAAINEVAQGGGGGTAASVSYDNTVSGLTATDVQDAIDEVVSMIGGGGQYVEVNSSGTTYSALIDSLFALIDPTKITDRAYVKYNDGTGVMILNLAYVDASYYQFACSRAYAGQDVKTFSMKIMASSSIYTSGQTDYSASVCAAGQKIRLYY